MSRKNNKQTNEQKHESNGLTLKQLLVKALSSKEPRGLKQIMEVSGLRAKQIRYVHLHELQEDGQVKKDGHKYLLTAKGTKAAKKIRKAS